MLKNKSKRKRGGEVTTENEVSKKPNVIYLGRIPHGFYEDEMAGKSRLSIQILSIYNVHNCMFLKSGFFGQFGKITRLRLSRNKKVNIFSLNKYPCVSKFNALCFCLYFRQENQNISLLLNLSPQK